MRLPSFTNQFEKDLKKMEKRGKALSKIKKVIRKLVDEERLEAKFKDHKLVGNYKDRRECHIESDWLLIYKFRSRNLI